MEKHSVFSTYKLLIEIIFVKNKIFYMTVHTERVLIVTNNYFVRNKNWPNICDCIIKNGHLLINILVSEYWLPVKQVNCSFYMFAWERYHTVLS